MVFVIDIEIYPNVHKTSPSHIFINFNINIWVIEVRILKNQFYPLS